MALTEDDDDGDSKMPIECQAALSVEAEEKKTQQAERRIEREIETDKMKEMRYELACVRARTSQRTVKVLEALCKMKWASE